jgi:hypothetical protein
VSGTARRSQPRELTARAEWSVAGCREPVRWSSSEPPLVCCGCRGATGGISCAGRWPPSSDHPPRNSHTRTGPSSWETVEVRWRPKATTCSADPCIVGSRSAALRLPDVRERRGLPGCAPSFDSVWRSTTDSCRALLRERLPDSPLVSELDARSPVYPEGCRPLLDPASGQSAWNSLRGPTGRRRNANRSPITRRSRASA